MFKLPASFAFLCFTTLCSTTVHSEEGKSSIKIIDPDKRIATANVAALDTEHFEVGVHVGMLSVEDFNTNPVIGASLRFYFNEKVFIEGSIGSSETEQSNPEDFTDQNFVEDRDFSYVGISAGYQLLKGRSFLGKKRKYNTGLYLTGGLEQVDFAGDTNTGVVVGISYKTAFTDWLSLNLDFKDHFVSRDILDDDKMTHNSEIALGVSFFF